MGLILWDNWKSCDEGMTDAAGSRGDPEGVKSVGVVDPARTADTSCSEIERKRQRKA